MRRRITLYYGRVPGIRFWMSLDRRSWVVNVGGEGAWFAYRDSYGASGWRGRPDAAEAAKDLNQYHRLEVRFSKRFRWLNAPKRPPYAWRASDLVPARSIRALVEPSIPDPAAETPK